MGLPNETSLECEFCGSFNIEDGVLMAGKLYCWDCIKKPDFKAVLKNLKKKKK